MIDPSTISKKTFSGKILRLILKIIPHHYAITVVQGSLKGYKWIKGSGVNSYWLGTYEKEQQEIFEKKIKSGDVVFDIGANVGFYSLIASKKIGVKGKVYAFEPAPRNLYYLKKHFEINNCHNAILVSGAVSNKNDMVYFNDGDHPATGFLSNDTGNLLVPTFNLDELIENKKVLAPNLIKIDVEGAEFDVLRGAIKLLNQYHPTIFLSTHNEKAHIECLSLLRSLNYKLNSLDDLHIEKTSGILATY